MTDRKLKVTEDVDAMVIMRKLRKICYADIVSVRELEKKKEKPKKEEKEEPKKLEEKKKEDQVAQLVKAYHAYNPPMTQYYFVRNVDEDPNACIIC